MNTKILMMISALLMGFCGILLQFIPQEVLRFFNVEPNGFLSLFVQMMGAMYLGFAMTNWMAKTVLVGGIYARPLAMGNLIHFTVGALALLKFAFSAPDLLIVWIAAVIYSSLAILFGIVVFTHPQKIAKVK